MDRIDESLKNSLASERQVALLDAIIEIEREALAVLRSGKIGCAQERVLSLKDAIKRIQKLLSK